MFRQAATKYVEEVQEMVSQEAQREVHATAVDGAEGHTDDEPMNGEEEPAPGTVPAGAFGGANEAEGFLMRKHQFEAGGKKASNRYVFFIICLNRSFSCDQSLCHLTIYILILYSS